ncbi:hypothetical protein [Methanosphaerula palustris]|uniref:Uncharacterized protein n=1 Tax=Methanosphaerula palustris (strain ATCC BAA-1556 / DSM 19958 / E1-9c) TaxID=521011 RepID=B8GKM9_METPE|nr:hypothetical protein [Methanosphaerula palustris]ACL17175.1 hypothetical protein Mpal_1870 [Methanosphaerula palustris E1-9c]
MLGLMLMLVPAVSAGGVTNSINQTHITEIRDRIVNTSHITEVMMQGSIQYIDQISNSSGATAMTTTRDNYVSAAASLSSIQNGTELRTAEKNLGTVERLFFNQTQVAVKTYNGTKTALKQSINESLSAAGLNENSFGPGPGPAHGPARNETASPDFAGNATNATAGHGHAHGSAGNETPPPDFGGNTTACPDHAPDFAGNETAPPDFAGNATNATAGHGHAHGSAGNETAPPDFDRNTTAGPDHAPDFAVNGTSVLGNGSTGRHHLGVNATNS